MEDIRFAEDFVLALDYVDADGCPGEALHSKKKIGTILIKIEKEVKTQELIKNVSICILI
jgi:hypothetical protein